jgi:hypothetical protein
MNNTTKTIEYGNWLNTMDWNCFCTLSTSYFLTMKQARRAADRLHSFLNTNYGNAKIFWVAEPFDSNVGCHVHALVSFNSSSVIKDMVSIIKRAWQVVTKGNRGKKHNHTVIRPYESSLGANFYVSKYMLRNNSDYDILV